MNYRIEVLFSINNDEIDQQMPLEADLVDLIYNQGRFIPEGVLCDIKDLQVDVF